MKQRIVLIGLVLGVVATACDRESPPPPEVGKAPAAAEKIIRTDARNARIDVTLPLIPNAVANCRPSKNGYAAGEPILLTINLNEAPEGLNVGARLLDSGDEQVAWVQAPGAGQKSVTVTLDGVSEPGSYTLEGYWGGNLVCEHSIRIGAEEPQRKP